MLTFEDANEVLSVKALGGTGLAVEEGILESELFGSERHGELGCEL